MAIASSLDTGHLRPLDVRSDLASIADLIELCFSDHMDAEGRDYIRYIRRVSQNNSLIRWVPGAAELVSLPLHGYVWQEDNRVIGNLSIIPFFFQNHWIYLIANVAVHPDYRRQGIGRKLTLRAIDHIRKHEVSEAWLQVRDDNSGAYQLYRSLGFVERTRRTTWQGNSIPLTNPPALSPGLTIQPRRSADWEVQAGWLQQVYPPEVTWNLSFDWRRLRPGLLRAFTAWINGENFLHWTVFARQTPIGMATWEPGRSLTDMIWLGAHPAYEDQAILALLTHIRAQRLTSRYLTINYPAGHGLLAFQQAGFTALNTLAWMSLTTSRAT